MGSRFSGPAAFLPPCLCREKNGHEKLIGCISDIAERTAWCEPVEYNGPVSETKPFRLTESVKAAG
jgi:hypothetical protein